MPIILGKLNWLIGTRLFYTPGSGSLLSNVAMVEGDPGFIEVAVLNRSSGAGYFMVVSRLPVPLHARRAAQAAAATLARQVPKSNFELLRRNFPGYFRSLPG